MRAVAEVVVAQLVEIEAAHVDGEILGPIVGAALEDDVGAGLEVADRVGAGSERRLERCLIERVRGVVGLRQDRQLGHHERQIAREVALEGVAHGVGVERLGLVDVAQRQHERAGALSFRVSKLKTTSSAVSGEPSANFASGRSLKVTDLPSGAISALLATRP